MATTLLQQFPLHLLINGEEFTFLVDEDFTFSCTDPGGFEAATFPVPLDLPQVQRGDPVVLHSGLQTAWEGRVKEVQRSLGAKTLVQCEGNAAILKEHNLAEIFVDRDLTKWEGSSLARQILLSTRPVLGAQIAGEPGEGVPSLQTSVTGPWATGVSPTVEAWYNAHGLPIGGIYYSWRKGINVNAGDVNWFWAPFLSTDSTGSSIDSAGNQLGNGPGSGYLQASIVGRLFAAIELAYGTTAGGTSGTEYPIYWSKLAVYGNAFINFMQVLLGKSGIVGRGPDPVGFFASDFARFAISKCPGVVAGVIEDSELIIPHAAYPSPVPIEQMVDDFAKLAACHWGVWESLSYMVGSQLPRVDFRQSPEPGNPTAWALRQECEELDIREAIDNMFDSAIVTFTEPSGEERSVEVKRPNPALEANGLHRQAPLNFGQGSQASAEAWGQVQLALLEDQARMTGSASLAEPIHELNGTAKAPWMLRAGLDRLRIPDLPCSDVWGEHNDLPITRVECTGGEKGLVTNVEFGMGPNLIETLAAQLQANETAAGV